MMAAQTRTEATQENQPKREHGAGGAAVAAATAPKPPPPAAVESEWPSPPVTPLAWEWDADSSI